jgi:hypothetical protein
MGGPAATEEGRLAAPGRPRRRAAWDSADRRAVLVLVVLPVLVFAGPALFGYPAITGDNAIQTFPLRIFSGELLRQGHLPLWNPYLWSGTPLLGGLNAGSLDPFTLLYSVLPGVAAWVFNLLGAYWAGGLGLYALLRQFRLAPLAAFLAALTYAFGGAMVGQMVHLPIVEGMGWIPVMVLAQFRLAWAVLRTGPAGADGEAGRPPVASPWPWVALLAAAIGLIFLTGEPRGMAEAELVAAPLALWLAGRRYPGVTIVPARRAAYLGYSLLAAAWATAIGAVQLVPGWAFITSSQRSAEPYSFLASGSLHTSWSALLLVPDLFGGNGIGNQPTFFSSYNLPEVTGYVGLLPLVAVVVLLGRSVGRRRDRRALEFLPWFFLVVFGLLLSFGEYTPLGHLFVHIPFYSRVRLPSRSLGIVDLAVCVLFGYWLDALLAGHAAPARLSARRWRERASVLAVPVATLTLCVVAFVAPVALETWFRGTGGTVTAGAEMRPWFVAQAAVALAVGALVLFWPRLSPDWRRALLVAVVFCDLMVFNLSSATGYVPEHTPVTPVTAQATAVLGTTGRFAIFDTTAERVSRLITVGQPDLNDLVRLPSVQGYGSLVGGSYFAATGAHTLDNLSNCALQSGVFAPLRLKTLITPSAFLAPPIGSNGFVPTEYDSPPAPCPGAPLPGTPEKRTFYLGQTLSLRAVTLGRADRTFHRPADYVAHPLRVGVIEPSGATVFPKQRVVAAAKSWSVRFAAPVRAVGLVVTGPADEVADESSVRATDGDAYALDGELQDALDQAGWKLDGSWAGYARFVRVSIRPPVWIATSAGGSSVVQRSTTDWGTETDAVTASRPVTVVRSEAYLSGWRAVATPAHGPARSLPVTRYGLIQAVRVPAGTWTLTFSYRPRGLTAAGAASGVGVVGLVVVAVQAVRRRRGRPGGGPAVQ